MKQARLRHVGILIQNWDKIRPFYEGLGFELTYEQEEIWIGTLIRVRKMENQQGDMIEFITGNWPKNHIALLVDELPDHMGTCFHKVDFPTALEIKIMQDPEGNWIEFVKEL